MLDLGRTFLQSVERSPHALALVDGDLRLTYAQWHRIILNVADGLRELGLARGDRLLVVLQNRWEMATLHWACQFAGIVIVPLNWRAKPEELDYCVTDAGVKAIVYEPVCADAVVQSPRGAETCRASDWTMRRAARRPSTRCSSNANAGPSDPNADAQPPTTAR